MIESHLGISKCRWEDNSILRNKMGFICLKVGTRWRGLIEMQALEFSEFQGILNYLSVY
jgi:hypothetical protein